jgi:hypothetical protein
MQVGWALVARSFPSSRNKIGTLGQVDEFKEYLSWYPFLIHPSERWSRHHVVSISCRDLGYVTRLTRSDFVLRKCVRNSFELLTFRDRFVINKNWSPYWEFSDEFAVITIELSYCEYVTTTNDNWTNHKTSVEYARPFYFQYLIRVFRVFKFNDRF